VLPRDGIPKDVGGVQGGSTGIKGFSTAGRGRSSLTPIQLPPLRPTVESYDGT